MPADRVLRLRRTDLEGEHLLVNVSSSGSKPLDLKLVASEGEYVYPAKIKESNIKSLQASNYSGNLDDWKAILKYALLQERSEGSAPDAFNGLETVTAISGTTLTITLRKNISGITQRIGSIKLEQNGDEEISVFEWAGTAVATTDDLRSQLNILQASVSLQQEQVTKLNQQLDDLVKAKKEHEDELLKKFASLLNAKKLKIRDQQRLLSGAKIDPEAAGTVSDARNGSRGGRTAAASRSGKRKANGAVAGLDMDEVPADEDIVTEDEDDDALVRREETPQNSDRDATEDEDSNVDGFEAAPVPSQASRRAVGSKAPEAVKSKVKGGDVKMEAEDSGEPPPKRALPFPRRPNAKAEENNKSELARPDDDDKDRDDETDEEL